MKEFESRNSIIIPVVIAVIITVGTLGAVYIANTGPTTIPTTSSTSSTTSPTSSTTTGTTTSPTQPVGTYGALAAEYLNSRRNDVEFMWSCNNSFVNQNLTEYYDGQHAGAYVDGLYMIRNVSPLIRVLFAPHTHENVGEGTVSNETWNTLAGALVDDGIAFMPNAESYPTDPWEYYPPTYSVLVCFNDGGCFYMAHFGPQNLVFIANGTWDGYRFNGWPNDNVDYDHGVFMNENGHLDSYMTLLYSTVTGNVDYP